MKSASPNSYAISVRGVGKKFHLGGGAAHDTLRDQLTAMLKGRGGRKSNDFWALQDVSFDVPPGQAVGIVGRNGAGKSTLLKIMSRISDPTDGEIRVRGRMSSLLEVGTGFHPELSGRENIYLNGAILGMRHAEIRKKFDAIVAFAEVESFLDTPVKRYSSGMYVRLAFAVAAHLDSEILIVDEVLAVGDGAFQAKCLQKMDEATSRAGRTVLFVSHNLAAVQRLCTRGIYLENGKLRADGPMSTVLESYQRALDSTSVAPDGSSQNALKPGEARFVSWELIGAKGEEKHSCPTASLCEFRIRLRSRADLKDATLGFVLWNGQSEIVVAGNTVSNHMPLLEIGEGDYEIIVRVRLPVRAGLYQLDVSLNSKTHGQIERGFMEPKLNILPPETTLPEKWQGLLTEPLEFDIQPATP